MTEPFDLPIIFCCQFEHIFPIINVIFVLSNQLEHDVLDNIASTRGNGCAHATPCGILNLPYVR